MTLSVWRYSHLALAVSSFVFILLASLTGLVLAFEPVSHRLQPYAIAQLDEVTLAETVASVRKQYTEVIEIKVEKNRFVQADVITDAGDSQQIYIDPKTGKSLGKVAPESAFFQWVTSLHRSLFLHGLGRVFMGVSAFLLLLIALTGSILVLKRQRGLSRFFSKVVREDFFQFYHVVFGRIWLVPILLIAATGTFLSLNEFGVFPDVEKELPEPDAFGSTPKLDPEAFKAFRESKLSEVLSVEFPFSSAPEDVYLVTRKDARWTVNQFTGEILTNQPETGLAYWVRTSLDLHTGRASILWALVLAIATLNILFFIYSGFAMTLKRQSGKVRNPFKKNQANYLVLAGSENGSTMRFAKAFHESLLKAGVKSYFTELNQYDIFPSATHIIVITATYGQGAPPANAKKALNLIQRHPQQHPVWFAVLGFGSHAYPDFCQFAYAIHNQLSAQTHLTPLLETGTVNDKSIERFTHWVAAFAAKTQLSLVLNAASLAAKPLKRTPFKVVEKTMAGLENRTFLLRLAPLRKTSFRSGDLLAVYPADDLRERQYSIGKIQQDLQLSVKVHEGGLGSNYLNQLEVGDTINAAIVANPEFHFPKKSASVILISNGTGIAPFLGMISENQKANLQLYCGFRNEDSFLPYRDFLQSQLVDGKLSGLHVAYSRQGEKQYVRDLLYRDRDVITTVLQNGGVMLICGTLAMQHNVLELLAGICEAMGHSLAHFEAIGQIKTDCY